MKPDETTNSKKNFVYDDDIIKFWKNCGYTVEFVQTEKIINPLHTITMDCLNFCYSIFRNSDYIIAGEKTPAIVEVNKRKGYYELAFSSTAATYFAAKKANIEEILVRYRKEDDDE